MEVMFIQASKLINLPIGALDTQSRVARLVDIITNPEDGDILGFLAKPAGLLSKFKVISKNEVVEIDARGLVIQSEETMVEPREIVRINEALNKNTKILGALAVTENGKSLGRIYDFLIDQSTLAIYKIYIRGTWEDRILPFDKVVKIEKGRVIFADDTLEKTVNVEVQEAAA